MEEVSVGGPFLNLEMVNMICWNLRVLNSPNKQKEAKVLCNNEQVGIMGLPETKIKSNKIETIANKYV